MADIRDDLRALKEHLDQQGDVVPGWVLGVRSRTEYTSWVLRHMLEFPVGPDGMVAMMDGLDVVEVPGLRVLFHVMPRRVTGGPDASEWTA
jgi:hypothetical protein